MILITSRLQMKYLYIISDVLYFLIYYFVRYRLGIVRKNLINSFPNKSVSSKKEIERNFYKWLCDYFVETLKLLTVPKEDLNSMIQFKGIDKVMEMAETGKSIGVFSPHFANWELLTAFPSFMTKSPHPTLYILYHVLHNHFFDWLMIQIRQCQGAVCIPKQDLLRYIKANEDLKQNAIYGYCFDQAPKYENIHQWLTFMNQDTPVLSGAERICRKKHHAVFYADMIKTGRGKYVCKFICLSEDAFYSEEGEITSMAFSFAEKAINRQPEMYLWTHNRWKRNRKEWINYLSNRKREK